jgi:hypothetical protein
MAQNMLEGAGVRQAETIAVRGVIRHAQSDTPRTTGYLPTAECRSPRALDIAIPEQIILPMDARVLVRHSPTGSVFVALLT